MKYAFECHCTRCTKPTPSHAHSQTSLPAADSWQPLQALVAGTEEAAPGPLVAALHKVEALLMGVGEVPEEMEVDGEQRAAEGAHMPQSEGAAEGTGRQATDAARKAQEDGPGCSSRILPAAGLRVRSLPAQAFELAHAALSATADAAADVAAAGSAEQGGEGASSRAAALGRVGPAHHCVLGLAALGASAASACADKQKHLWKQQQQQQHRDGEQGRGQGQEAEEQQVNGLNRYSAAEEPACKRARLQAAPEGTPAAIGASDSSSTNGKQVAWLCAALCCHLLQCSAAEARLAAGKLRVLRF